MSMKNYPIYAALLASMATANVILVDPKAGNPIHLPKQPRKAEWSVAISKTPIHNINGGMPD